MRSITQYLSESTQESIEYKGWKISFSPFESESRKGYASSATKGKEKLSIRGIFQSPEEAIFHYKNIIDRRK